MYNSFISQENDNEQSQKCKENMLLKTYICQSMQGMLTRKHAKHEHVIMWARGHARHIDTWAREHARHVDTWASRHASHDGTSARKHTRHVSAWARKHTRHVGTWARKHARHVSTRACKVWNLADSCQLFFIKFLFFTKW